MVMITIHIAYITCLVTNDAWHAYDLIGVYKIHHGAGRRLCDFRLHRQEEVVNINSVRSSGFTFHGAGNTVVGWDGKSDSSEDINYFISDVCSD